MKKLAIVLSVILFGLINLSGGEHVQEVEYQTHKVKCGETFWGITERYRDIDARNLYIFDYQDEVRELNPWLVERHCQLQPNDLVVVKFYRKK